MLQHLLLHLQPHHHLRLQLRLHGPLVVVKSQMMAVLAAFALVQGCHQPAQAALLAAAAALGPHPTLSLALALPLGLDWGQGWR